jgi:hypothetical protein
LERACAELGEKADREHAEEQHADSGRELGDELREIVELQLERCVLCVTAHHDGSGAFLL